MKITIKKRSVTMFLIVLCYLCTIVTALVPTTAMRYLMYSIVIGMAFYMNIFDKKKLLYQKNSHIVFCGVVLVEFVSIITGFMEGYIDPGTIIQPIFLYASFVLGQHIATSYGEEGCDVFFKQLSIIFVFSAIICVPEYIMKKSIFFKTYGNTWDAFRTPSIYGHPIRLGTSLTIALAIFYYLYKRGFIRNIVIFLALFGIFASASRSSWLACAGVVLLTLMAKFKRKITRKKMFYVIAGLLLIIIFFSCPIGQKLTADIISRFQEASGDNVSKVQRLGAIAYFWEDYVENFNLITLLFGHGEDAAARFMLKTAIVFQNFSTTDNEYLLVVYNYGLIILCIVLYGIYRCIRNYIFCYEENGRVKNCLYFICISQAICSFFYEITENKSCAFLLMCSIGMLMGLKEATSCDMCEKIINE